MEEGGGKESREKGRDGFVVGGSQEPRGWKRSKDFNPVPFDSEKMKISDSLKIITMAAKAAL